MPRRVACAQNQSPQEVPALPVAALESETRTGEPMRLLVNIAVVIIASAAITAVLGRLDSTHHPSRLTYVMSIVFSLAIRGVFWLVWRT